MKTFNEQMEANRKKADRLYFAVGIPIVAVALAVAFIGFFGG